MRALLGLAILALATGALVALDQSALCLAPALALAAPLLLRRYPGERIVTVLARGRTGRRWTLPARALRPRRRCVAAALTPRGGLLLACSLAVRPPPGPARVTG